MYATKSQCRECLLSYKDYIKLTVFAKEYGVSTSNLSMFLKGSEYDHYLSLIKLNGFILYIKRQLNDYIL